MATIQTVLVTGASGFIGFSIVHQLLEAGYRVRGTARGHKLENLKNALAHIPKFEAVEVTDIADVDLSKVLDGVDAIVHTAAPLPGRSDPSSAVKKAVDASLGILKHADNAGVKKVVVTSSIVAYPRLGPYGLNDWNPVTEENALSGDPWVVYMAEKKFSDQAMVEYVKEHPQIDLTILYPPWVFGPLAPNSEKLIPKPDFAALSSNTHIYNLLDPKHTAYPDPIVIDVRDLAHAHLLALNSTAPSPKRLAIRANYFASFRNAIRFIAEAHPELAGQNRLADPEKAPEDLPHMEFDWTMVGEVLGMTAGSCRSWKETVVDTVESLLELEKSWKDNGMELPSV